MAIGPYWYHILQSVGGHCSFNRHSTGRRFRYAHGDLGVSLNYSKSPQKRGPGVKIWYFHALSTLPLRFGGHCSLLLSYISIGRFSFVLTGIIYINWSVAIVPYWYHILQSVGCHWSLLVLYTPIGQWPLVLSGIILQSVSGHWSLLVSNISIGW